MDTKLKLLIFVAAIAVLAGIGGSITYAATAESTASSGGGAALGWIAIGAAIAIAAPGVAAAIGLSMATSSIAAAGAERPEIIGKFFIFVVFIEAIAIYALIVAIFIILMLPAFL